MAMNGLQRSCGKPGGLVCRASTCCVRCLSSWHWRGAPEVAAMDGAGWSDATGVAMSLRATLLPSVACLLLALLSCPASVRWQPAQSQVLAFLSWQELWSGLRATRALGYSHAAFILSAALREGPQSHALVGRPGKEAGGEASKRPPPAPQRPSQGVGLPWVVGSSVGVLSEQVAWPPPWCISVTSLSPAMGLPHCVPSLTGGHGHVPSESQR